MSFTMLLWVLIIVGGVALVAILLAALGVFKK